MVSKEAELEGKAFTQNPVAAIVAFLSCFDREGAQGVEVPRHVLEALALAFGKIWKGEASSLDARIRREDISADKFCSD